MLPEETESRAPVWGAGKSVGEVLVHMRGIVASQKKGWPEGIHEFMTQPWPTDCDDNFEPTGSKEFKEIMYNNWFHDERGTQSACRRTG